MFFLYLISGMGAYMVSALLTPYSISVGSSPALYGLLASLVARFVVSSSRYGVFLTPRESMQFVELFQSWQLLDKPGIELLKLIVACAFALAIGFLPYVDNFAHGKSRRALFFRGAVCD